MSRKKGRARDREESRSLEPQEEAERPQAASQDAPRPVSETQESVGTPAVGPGAGAGDSVTSQPSGAAPGEQASNLPPPARRANTAGLARLSTGGRLVGSRFGTWINGLSYLSKWLILAAAIGVVAGLGAVAFYEALTYATHLFLGVLGGYHVPTPAGEGGAAGSGHYVRAWAIPLIVVLGGILSGFLVFTWAPEAEGHGTDAAIDAVHYNPRGIRLRAIVVKIIASAFTIGSGGSGGREGPTAQISAGFGSLLTRVLDLSPEDGRIAVSVGIGSGIGAIFSAPLGGAVLAADIVYRDDFEFSALVPGFFASIIAYTIFGAFVGYRPLFGIPGTYHFSRPIQLLWFAIIGLLAGGIGLLYSKGFYGVVSLTRRLPFTRKLQPAVGALLVGLLALWLPQVLGTGYGWVQKGLSTGLLHTPLYIILVLPLARIAATALSIGTGGSGGVFGPGMVIGSFTGLAVWRVLEPIAPGVGHDPTPFVIVGMMAVFGGISRAPLAVMIMVSEMTGSLKILAPALVAVAISAFIVGRTNDTIYRSQLRSRADTQASRLEFGMPLLGLLTVGEVAQKPRVLAHIGTKAADVLAELRVARAPGAPIVDERGLYLGTVEAQRLEQLLEQDSQALVDRGLDTTTATVPARTRLNAALDALLKAGGSWVTVSGASRQVVGTLGVSDIVHAYQQALETNVRHISNVSSSAITLEEVVGADSPLIGVPLRDAHLPHGCIVISVQRGNEMLFANGTTTLNDRDIVSVLTSPASAEEVRRLLLGSALPKPPLVERGSQMV